MTSIPTRTKQSFGYFVPLGDCTSSILQFSGGAGAGGSYIPGAFTAATWASNGTSPSTWATRTIGAIGKGGLLKDMGKTVVSASRTFRKVQLVCSAPSTSGVAGGAANENGMFLTGYIELPTGQAGALQGQGAGYNAFAPTIAPVAYMPGLLM
jgi:hypothetical protein